jgi:hypothetical protein
MILICSCGEVFNDENPLNRDVIMPWFHAVAGHTLSEETEPAATIPMADARGSEA